MGFDMTTLNLGVLDIPRQTFVEGRPVDSASPLMMSELADILEDKYHVFEHFWQMHKEEIASELISAMNKELFQKGSGRRIQFTNRALTEIKNKFSRFITMKEMDALGYPGIPTQASLDGVDHRKKHPYAKRPPRPSFDDTGQYMTSFIAWLD